MSSNEDFFDGMKSDEDKTKEWMDSAQFFVSLRRPWEREETAPEPEQGVVKVSADFRRIGGAALKGLSRLDPTGVAKAMSTKPGAIAGLAGASLFGGGMYHQSRPQAEHHGQSSLEHSLVESKKLRDASPEPKGMFGKLKNHAADLTTSLASTARKHPIKASLVAGLGGAKAGTKLLSAFTRKASK